METHLGALGATAAVCERQRHHLEHTRRYVTHRCGRTEAFGGVLRLLAGSYGAALAAAERGLADAGSVADALAEGVRRFRDDVAVTDEAAEDRLRRHAVGLGDVAGSGRGGAAGWGW